MARAAQAELDKAGIDERPKLALADAATGTAPRSTSSRPAGSRFSARPMPTVAGRRRRSDRGPDYERMRRRQQMIEPAFAQMKLRQRAGRFSRRGSSACRAEWRLTAATHNLLRPLTCGWNPRGTRALWAEPSLCERGRQRRELPLEAACPLGQPHRREPIVRRALRSARERLAARCTMDVRFASSHGGRRFPASTHGRLGSVDPNSQRQMASHRVRFLEPQGLEPQDRS